MLPGIERVRDVGVVLIGGRDLLRITRVDGNGRLGEKSRLGSEVRHLRLRRRRQVLAASQRCEGERQAESDEGLGAKVYPWPAQAVRMERHGSPSTETGLGLLPSARHCNAELGSTGTGVPLYYGREREGILR